MNSGRDSDQTWFNARNQFSLYKSFSSYFRILIFILVDRAVCSEHLRIIYFW